MLGLPLEAIGLWFECLMWLDEYGGYVIPREVAGRTDLASVLVRNGLWDDGPDEGSYRMLHYEPGGDPETAG
jgi:hypothetical protein